MVEPTITVTGVVERRLAALQCLLVKPKFSICAGFTLIEMLVVLGLIAMIGMIAFFGMSTYRSDQPLVNAQREFVTTLRSLQNQVNNGADGVSVRSLVVRIAPNNTSYIIVNSYIPTLLTSKIDLPSGVTMAITTPTISSDTAICFSHPNLPNFDTGRKCVSLVDGSNACASGVGILCTGNTTNSTSVIKIHFTYQSFSKDVVIESAGMKISRVYAQ